MSKSNEPILDIGTVVDRKTINLRSKKHPEGKLYEVINLDELGAFEHAIIVKRHQKMEELDRSDRAMTAAEKRLLRKTIKDILGLVIVDVEPQVLAEIEVISGAKIITAWLRANATDEAQGAAEGEA